MISFLNYKVVAHTIIILIFILNLDGFMTAISSKKLKEIFQIVLELPEDVDYSNIRQITESKWDSLAHTSLIAAMESEFELTFDAKSYERLTSFAAAELLLKESGI